MPAPGLSIACIPITHLNDKRGLIRTGVFYTYAHRVVRVMHTYISGLARSALQTGPENTYLRCSANVTVPFMRRKANVT